MAARHETPAALRRKRRRTALVLGAMFLVVVGVHLRNRVADRSAWPEPAAPKPIPDVLTSPDATNAWHLFAALPVPREEFPDIHDAARKELARFHAGGGFAPTNAFPAIDEWVERMTPALARWHEAAESGAASFCDSPDLPTQYAVLGKARECAVLAPYLAARARRDGDWDRCVSIWSDSLRNTPKVTFGTGTAGQVVAYDMTLGVTRDMLASLRAIPRGELLRAKAELDRNLQSSIPGQPLAESIRHDGVAARAVLGAFFPDNPAFGAPPPGLQPPSGFFRWIARRNGSSPEVSVAHFDAVLTQVIAAADQPYSASGLYARLPAWCRGRRPPWTNDPAAATAVCHLRDNTISAGVYPVLREMELRAVSYALRLETLPEGADAEAARAAAFGDDGQLLCPDPFATNSAPFALDAPPPSWRFHSVGPDQRDDGGTNDWATARRAGPGLDFLFSVSGPDVLTPLPRSGTVPAPSRTGEGSTLSAQRQESTP